MKPLRLPQTQLTPPLDFAKAAANFKQLLLGEKKQCLRCGSIEGVESESARTAYNYDAAAGEEDPNKPILLCRPCAAEHHAAWDEQWNEYFRGRI